MSPAIEVSKAAPAFTLPNQDGEKRYFVYTRWESEEAFLAWVNSESFTRGHAQASADRGEQPVAHGSHLLSFDVVQKVDGGKKS